jgi:uridine kinase
MSWQKCLNKLAECRAVNVETNLLWNQNKIKKCAFVTNRLSSDGVAVVTELQAQTIHKHLNWEDPTIITGRIDSLWTGKTAVSIVPELAIPNSFSEALFKGKLFDEEYFSNELIKQADYLASKIIKEIKENSINLLIAQNINSLPYNLVAAFALILASEMAKIPVLHQAFDFYWQHTMYTRSRFRDEPPNEILTKLIDVITKWDSKLWHFATPNETFREIVINKGFDPSKISTLVTPVSKPTRNKRSINYLIQQCPLQATSQFYINIRCKYNFEFDELSYKSSDIFTVLFPAKLSMGKNIPSSIKDTLMLIRDYNDMVPIRLILTGAPYDMETDEDLLTLKENFQNLFEFIEKQIHSKQLNPCQIIYLCGTPRFKNQDSYTMDDLYQFANLVVFGSTVETDCIGLFETILARKPCWLRPWIDNYHDIFNEITERLVVGILSETKSSVFNPFDVEGINAITDHNYGIISKKYSAKTFCHQFNSIISNKISDEIKESAKIVADLFESKIVKGGLVNIKVICIGGQAASGKSTLANFIVDERRSKGYQCVSISLDDYTQEGYLSIDGRNFSRQAINISRIIDDVKKLKTGLACILPKYYHGVPNRSVTLGYSNSWIIVEGVYALTKAGKSVSGSYEQLRNISDLDVMIDDFSNEPLIRCLRHDAENNLTLERILFRYKERRIELDEIRQDVNVAQLKIQTTDNWRNVQWEWNL